MFHHQLELAVLFTRIEDLNNVRTIELSNSQRLVSEPCLKGFVKGQMRVHHLDRNLSTQVQIKATVDLAHTASADKRFDLVMTKDLSR